MTYKLDLYGHLIITEDGRGLAGGSFMIRNSPEGRALVESVYGTYMMIRNIEQHSERILVNGTLD